jgi:hypothetical protein
MSKHDNTDPPRDPVGEISPSAEEGPEQRRVRFYRALRDAGYDDLTIIRREDVADEFNHRHFAIIDYLREESADSVRDLARELDFVRGISQRTYSFSPVSKSSRARQTAEPRFLA